MWLWESELRALGFRRRSERYWQCARRFGLAEGDYLSLFAWAEQPLPGVDGAAARLLVEVDTFHVTFPRGGENLHFYYHQRLENAWEPAGHTSRREILRAGGDPTALRAAADAIASAFVAELASVLRPRPEEHRGGG